MFLTLKLYIYAKLYSLFKKKQQLKHFHITHIYSNVCKQMTGVKLLLLHANSRKHSQIIKSKQKISF